MTLTKKQTDLACAKLAAPCKPHAKIGWSKDCIHSPAHAAILAICPSVLEEEDA